MKKKWRQKKINNVRTPRSERQKKGQGEKTIYDEISRNCHKNSQLAHGDQGEILELKA